MIDVKKCLETLKEIKKECGKHPSCNQCPFYDSKDKHDACLIDTEDAPSDWIIKSNNESEEK